MESSRVSKIIIIFAIVLNAKLKEGVDDVKLYNS